ncbi:MAG: FAD-binding protein, partial [Clostridia bacterium]|nr:FAD-binding protein [Clostridia bacterium]
MDKNQRIIESGIIIVGSGAAAYNAAVTLAEHGVTDLALVTEGRTDGTSRNTGSDKQTYYKLSLAGDSVDSVHEMAKDLFAPGCVDGDIALTEAALSTPCFLHLARLGVPFPTNAYGEYVGYKTDHDPRARATSAGPLTSKMMT